MENVDTVGVTGSIPVSLTSEGPTCGPDLAASRHGRRATTRPGMVLHRSLPASGAASGAARQRPAATAARRGEAVISARSRSASRSSRFVRLPVVRRRAAAGVRVVRLYEQPPAVLSQSETKSTGELAAMRRASPSVPLLPEGRRQCRADNTVPESGGRLLHDSEAPVVTAVQPSYGQTPSA
jgi:hypothetical protein